MPIYIEFEEINERERIQKLTNFLILNNIIWGFEILKRGGYATFNYFPNQLGKKKTIRNLYF